jgi:hypothetical protein
MAFLVGGANSASGAYEIENSIRVEADDSPKLSKTVSTATNTTQMTLSLWYKLGEPADMGFLSKFADSNNRFHLRIMADGSLLAYNNISGTYHYKTTTAKLRDYSAWYHIVFAYDTTDGTAADRVKIYLNGTRLTSFVNNTNPSSSEALKIASDTSNPIKVFCANDEDAYLSGYVADFYYIDGQAKAPTDFAETNDNGVWIPKKYSGTYGTNGFKLEFQQTGTGTASASTVGADTSGNDHHLTSANIAAIDITTDTPTNNFCVWNALEYSGDTALEEGNLQASGSDTADYHEGARGTIAVSSGKWYWEIKVVDVGDSTFAVFAGIMSADHQFRNDSEDELLLGTYGMRNADGKSVISSGSALAYATWGASFTDGDILNLALDMDNNRLYIGKGGSWSDGSGNIDEAAINAYLSLSTTPSAYMPMVLGYSEGDDANLQANFGNPPFSISSGNADANGYGNFEYAVPSGFYALCTKNLAEYG